MLYFSMSSACGEVLANILRNQEMKAGNLLSTHIWSPSGGKNARPQKQYQPVPFALNSFVHPSPKSTADVTFYKTCHKVVPQSLASLNAGKSSNEEEHGVKTNQVIWGREGSTDDDNKVDNLSSILNEDTDSNFSEDYQVMLSNEAVSRSQDISAQRNWFNYLRFKSQKEEFKKGVNQVHCYPFIEISSSVRKRGEDRPKAGFQQHKVKGHSLGNFNGNPSVCLPMCPSEIPCIRSSVHTSTHPSIADGEDKSMNINEDFTNRMDSPVAKYKMEVYKNQPLKIEDYEPGLKSSIFSNRPAKERKESGLRWYESDADVDYRESIEGASFDDSGYLSSTGISDNKYQRWGQQKDMEHVLKEEKVAKKKKEVLDNESRRHHDTLMPKEKQFLLDRYDNVAYVRPTINARLKGRAKVLFTFRPQHENELALKKGDVVQLLRRVDANWYKGEINGQVGVFPSNHVDVIISLEEARRLADDRAGRAVAIYEFIGRSPLELSFKKGEELLLIRRIDQNWFEGRLRGRQGIFPASYVDILMPPTSRPITPADEYSQVSRSSSSFSIGPEVPSPWNSDAYESEFEREYIISPPYKADSLMKQSNKNTFKLFNPSCKELRSTAGNTSSVQKKMFWREGGFSNVEGSLKKNKVSDENAAVSNLHVSTNGKKLGIIERCRALYTYEPQNEDELKLSDGDLLDVVEKCDDGWYIGLCRRTGCFGTFPGNYVERLGR